MPQKLNRLLSQAFSSGGPVPRLGYELWETAASRRRKLGRNGG
jgi:hypothetical protein